MQEAPMKKERDADPDPAKHGMRVRMREARARLAPAEAVRRAEAAYRILTALSVWTRARRIALYMPIRGEMATRLLFRQAAAEGKEVLLPRCVTDRKGILELAPCSDPEELKRGAFGILEPAGTATDLDDPGAGPDLLCAPALACDLLGYRLGWGGGYYDRLLIRPALRACVSIGLIYAFQLVPRLPVQSRDVRLRGICTEERMLWT